LDEEYEEDDEEELDKKIALAKNIMDQENNDENVLSCSEEDEDFDDITIDRKLQTPVSQVNEFSYMKNIFNQLYNDNTTYYNQIINVLNNDQQNILKAIFESATM